MELKSLRKKYSRFVFEKYSWKISGKNLEVFFDFKIEPDIFFKPKLVIENTPKKTKDLENLIFHLGLIEIPTYWKATCSPEIIVRAGFLDKEQISWWKSLILKGMGQFFYENRIDWRPESFLKIKCESDKKYKTVNKELKKRYLVPFSGGRDSIVTIELLKKKTALFLVNPNKLIKKTAKTTGVKNQIVVKRIMDKKLLGLNKKGYLNGHTPFTALLSFLSVFCAVLFDYKNIVFSNEKSANEGNVKYLGKTINHQWAKSSEFEKMFKRYCKKYLAKNINYSSFLRKYSELEISKMLTRYPKYFPVFSSCNAGMKTRAKPVRWCLNCPKCLFVYLTLYPFLNKRQLFLIFGKDIFQNKKLLPIMKSLIEKGEAKPFECVGTKKESLIALKLSLKKDEKAKMPYILTEMKKMI